MEWIGIETERERGQGIGTETEVRVRAWRLKETSLGGHENKTYNTVKFPIDINKYQFQHRKINYQFNLMQGVEKK